MWGWGYDKYGQLADGSTKNRFSPVLAEGIDEVIAISGGDHHTLALRADGTVWAWGSNGSGQLGDGTLASDNFSMATVAG